jgi:hypothetical protein|tara:strand:+ start:1695 stop:2189 length:495 start_codon:yes stop_codon:yes gene_type:complete
MIVEEYKNFLDKDFLDYLAKHYLFKIHHRYGEASIGGITKSIFFSTEVHNDEVTNFVTYKIFKKFKINKYQRIYINMQFNGMDGSWHIDEGDKTHMLMVTPTLKKDSGLFEIKDNDNKIHQINFEQNKLVVFNSKLLHRGLAPTEIGTPRITLVFKGVKDYERK